MSLARPRKLSHLDTIHYEIRMYRFCAERLSVMSTDAPDAGDRLSCYVFLEAFLVHYRNLVRFFSGKNHGRHDLSTQDPSVWAGRPLSVADENRLEMKIREPALGLEATHGKISKYLQHCTEVRSATDVEWDIAAMLRDLDPVVIAFEAAFPNEGGAPVRVNHGRRE